MVVFKKLAYNEAKWQLTKKLSHSLEAAFYD